MLTLVKSEGLGRGAPKLVTRSHKGHKFGLEEVFLSANEFLMSIAMAHRQKMFLWYLI